MSAILESSPVARLSRGWSLALLRGVAGIVFGLCILLWPGPSVVLFVWLFGAYAAADGLGAILIAVLSPAIPGRRWLVISGLASLAAGAVTVAAPGLVATWLVFVIGAWAVVRGLGEIASAAVLDRHVAKPWTLGLGGLVSLMLGAVLLIAGPVVGVLGIAWLIGACSIAFGAAAIAWAFRLRRLMS